MTVWNSVSDVPATLENTVVTIGNFDGVHRGHSSVLTRMVTDAQSMGSRAIVMTFYPHPLEVHHPERAPQLITGLTDRLELLSRTGVDVLLQKYTLEFARQSPEEFVRRFLVDGLRVSTAVVGHDIRFGWRNAGDLSTLMKLGERYGFAVDVIDDVHPPHEPPGRHRRWSSTWVRELLSDGDITGANEILGRPHRMRGVVVHGDGRGHELGFPTANLSNRSDGMVPADGVYAGWLTRTPWDERLPAAISVGTNPTFEQGQRRVEAYVLDADLDLYDAEVIVEFAHRVREQRTFTSIDALIETMRDDVARVRKLMVDH